MLQYEVMRVFPIVLPIGRITAQSHGLVVEASTADREMGTSTTHILPSGTGMIVNNTGIHYNPRYWPHPAILEPLRWLSANPNTYDPTVPTSADVNEAATNFPGHMKGTFLTFSEGPRSCLGKRFAQVEFVAFFARLLRLYRVELAPGEDRIEVEKRMRMRSGGSPVTLVPPEDVKLTLVARNQLSKECVILKA
jgi:cytochrome P450